MFVATVVGEKLNFSSGYAEVHAARDPNAADCLVKAHGASFCS